MLTRPEFSALHRLLSPESPNSFLRKTFPLSSYWPDVFFFFNSWSCYVVNLCLFSAILSLFSGNSFFVVVVSLLQFFLKAVHVSDIYSALIASHVALLLFSLLEAGNLEKPMDSEMLERERFSGNKTTPERQTLRTNSTATKKPTQ